MELFALFGGLCFWPLALFGAWRLAGRKGWSRRSGLTGVAVLALLPLTGAVSMGHYVLVDEPFFFACEQGNLAGARHYLSWGANPGTRFEGISALRAAEESGNRELVEWLRQRDARN